MRITLVHKPDAGPGGHSDRDVTQLLADQGHEVRYCSRDQDWRREIRNGCDLVVIGGGDGTVAKVVRELVGTTVPFAVLPLGTANNIATELGWLTPDGPRVPDFRRARRQRFSVGETKGPWGTRYFVEGVGIGAFASAMSFARAQKEILASTDADRASRLQRDRRVAHAVLVEANPTHVHLSLDGETMEGRFLAVEILNTGRIGPNLRLAPEADLGDEVLDVVLVGETERDGMLEYLAQPPGGELLPPPLPRHRVRNVRLAAESGRAHIDDVVWPKAGVPPAPGTGPIEFEAGLVEQRVYALVPPAADGG